MFLRLNRRILLTNLKEYLINLCKLSIIATLVFFVVTSLLNMKGCNKKPLSMASIDVDKSECKQDGVATIYSISGAFDNPILEIPIRDTNGQIIKLPSCNTSVIEAPETKIVLDPRTPINKYDYEWSKRLFLEQKEAIVFVKYIKTQSGRLDVDNLFVMQVIANRCRTQKISFIEYFNSPHVNNSESIMIMQYLMYKKPLKYPIKPSKLRQIERTITFDTNCKEDVQMLLRAYKVANNETEVGVTIPSNIWSFESFEKSPNKGVHRLSKLYTKIRHRFYYR